jgi:type VI secretion system protein ImpH
MATASWTQDAGLTESQIARALREDSCSFEFFQAVTLLQSLTQGRQPVGMFSNPQDEAVRFSVNNALPFPASQLQSLDIPEDGQPTMAVNFMGITGPSGVLPYCYTELLLDRKRAKDQSLADFLDIFHHRALSLFYRAWSKYHFPATYGREGLDVFTYHLLDLVGMGTPGLQERQALPDEALLHYVAHFSQQSRSAAALEQIVEDYFEVPAEIEQFAGAWYALHLDALCVMSDEEGPSQQLGGGAVIGDQVWDQKSRVRIKLGPLDLSQYREFLPDGSAFEPLRALTRTFCNDEFEFELQLILKREQTPRFQIVVGEETGPRLGWVSWLTSLPMHRNPEETILPL